MQSHIKIKPPQSTKECLGWSIRNIGSPILGGIIAYLMIQKVKWPLTVQILVGTFVLFPWFWMVSKLILSPIWNTLYVPVPDLPTDEGNIESNVYKSGDGNMYLMGIGLDIIQYKKESTSSKHTAIRLYENELALLVQTDDVVRLHYQFMRYRNGSVKIDMYRRVTGLVYKWPVYEYKILA